MTVVGHTDRGRSMLGDMGFAVLAFVVVTFGCVAPVLADELAAFDRGRAAYEAQQYRLAVQRFESLVGGRIPQLRSRPLVLESRKYLAVSYLFLKRRNDARAQFRLLLQQDASYVLDPVRFPSEAVALFTQVKQQLQAEQQAQARQRRRVQALAAEKQRRAMVAARAKQQRLLKLASTETVQWRHSRWLATVPFGLGQFQNGHRRLGIALAVTQAALTVLSLTSFFLHRSLDDEQPSADSIAEARRVERSLRVTNWVSTSLLFGTMAAGIVDAQLRFVAGRRETRRRPLPPKLHDPLPRVISAPATLGPTLQLRLRHRF